MNPTNNPEHNPNATPSGHDHPTPIVGGDLIGARDGGHWIFTKPRRGDRFDLTTGECRMACIVDGVRYDTATSTLVARHSGIDVYGLFHFRWLYLADHGAWFTVDIDGRVEQLLDTSSHLDPVPPQSVLQVARRMIEPGDCRQFLVAWYCGGWIPRDDAVARSWAEEALSADDCGIVLDATATMPNPE